jgi:hypothetical protein
MPIPPGTRFHGVAPGVDVQNRGSASRNALRDTYPIEDFGGAPSGSQFKAVLASPVSSFTVSVAISGWDSAKGMPTVTQSDTGYNHAGVIDRYDQNVVAGEEVTVTISGVVQQIRIADFGGVTPAPGKIFYMYNVSFGLVESSQNAFPIGRLIEPADVGGSYWKALIFPPEQNGYFFDNTQLNDSVRQLGLATTSMDPGDILAISNASASGSGNQDYKLKQVVRRWDPASGDTVDDIMGLCSWWEPIVYSGSGTNTTFINSGWMFLDQTYIGGTPATGAKVYSDNVTRHLLTTDPTSGVLIGILGRPAEGTNPWPLLVKL